MTAILILNIVFSSLVIFGIVGLLVRSIVTESAGAVLTLARTRRPVALAVTSAPRRPMPIATDA
jgi:hypothetical protein